MRTLTHHELLKKLVEINSVYPNEEEISNFCIDLLKDLNFVIDVVVIGIGRKNILAKRGKGDTAILFYGHLDTVGVVNSEEWNTDPFKLTQKGNNYYGLGVSDMKSGISSFLTALKNFPGYIKILLSVDEENISEGAWTVLEKKPEFFKDVNLIIASEPTMNAQLNSLTNGRVGRRVFEVTVAGKAAHLFNQSEGIDSINKLTGFMSKVYDLEKSLFESKYSRIQIRKISGESVGMSVPALATCEIEVLLGFGDTEKSVLEKLNQIDESVQIRLKDRKTPYLDPYLFKDYPFKEMIEEIIEKRIGKKVEYVYRSSVGDENVLATLGIPVITWGTKGGNEHTNNEYLEIKSFDQLNKMQEEFLSNLTKL